MSYFLVTNAFCVVWIVLLVILRYSDSRSFTPFCPLPRVAVLCLFGHQQRRRFFRDPVEDGDEILVGSVMCGLGVSRYARGAAVAPDVAMILIGLGCPFQCLYGI